MQWSARGAPLIMGILNLTPDSFSDGGKYQHLGQAVKHALRMVEEGADIIDVGGESTRPGAERIPAAEQLRRVLEVIRELHRQLPPQVPISIDTSLGEVALAAVEAGASIINDISAGREDARIFSLAAERHLSLVLMHMQGTPPTMQHDPHYEDVLEEVCSFLRQRASEAIAAGVQADRLILDPGIGFGKTCEHNLALLTGLDRIVQIGYPVLLGTSRKRFMRSVCRAAASEWIGACCATTALGVDKGACIFRVHDVQPNRQAADIAWRFRR